MKTCKQCVIGAKIMWPSNTNEGVTYGGYSVGFVTQYTTDLQYLFVYCPICSSPIDIDAIRNSAIASDTKIIHDAFKKMLIKAKE